MAQPVVRSVVVAPQPVSGVTYSATAPSVRTYAAPQATSQPGLRPIVRSAAPVSAGYRQPVSVVNGSVVKSSPLTYGAVAPAVNFNAPGDFKVCVCGGAGGIGQPLCMLMAQDENVKELCVFDLDISMVPAAGVAEDLDHLEKKARISAYSIPLGEKPINHLKDCLTGCHLVLVPAGLPRKPGQDRKDLLKTNAKIAADIMEACAEFCPNAVIGFIVNPVNSVVPAMCELWKRKGLDPRKICGVTTLDVVRANKFVHNITGAPMQDIKVPVVGGHAGKTILPLFSQCGVARTIDEAMIPELDAKVQNAGTIVVEKKNGKGSATLSMAYAGSQFGKAVLAGLRGIPTVHVAYVETPPDFSMAMGANLPYFAGNVEFGRDGAQRILPIGPLTQYETSRLNELVPILEDEIQAGLDYAASVE